MWPTQCSVLCFFVVQLMYSSFLRCIVKPVILLGVLPIVRRHAFLYVRLCVWLSLVVLFIVCYLSEGFFSNVRLRFEKDPLCCRRHDFASFVSLRSGQFCWSWWLISVMFPVVMNPLLAFELLFFAVFGMTTYDELTTKDKHLLRPPWTDNLFKVVFGIYMLVSVVVLINLLIAMMSDTYQRIQVITFCIFCDSSPKEPDQSFRVAVFCRIWPNRYRRLENRHL